jgi:hypothetical protein
MTYPKQSTTSHHENSNNINLVYTTVAIDDGKNKHNHKIYKKNIIL